MHFKESLFQIPLRPFAVPSFDFANLYPKIQVVANVNEESNPGLEGQMMYDESRGEIMVYRDGEWIPMATAQTKIDPLPKSGYIK